MNRQSSESPTAFESNLSLYHAVGYCTTHPGYPVTLSRRRFLALGSMGAASLSSRTMLGARKFDPGSLLFSIAPDFEELRASIKGALILPKDQGFDSARRVWSFNPRTDLRPAAIVRCADANDVARSVAFARQESLEVAVRGGGHDLLGASVCDGGLVIDLSKMKGIEIDPSTKTVRIQPGVISAELKAAAIPAGLAPVLGCNPGVGVAGLTLGGGIGWFLGTHGAACDNLLSANIITADGSNLRASADTNTDLFWAIRGGGGNFGIATELELQLHSIADVVGGVVAFRQSDIGPFLRFYRDFMNDAPDGLTVELSIFADPTPIVWAMVCWNGDPEKGLETLKPLRTFDVPIADTIEAGPWARFLNRMPQRTPPDGHNTYWRGGTLSVLSDTAIQQFSDAVQSAPRGWQLGVGHYLHGRISDVRDGVTPMPRKRGHSTHFISATWRDANEADSSMKWVDESWAALHRIANAGTYVNYVSESSEEAVKRSYGESYARLATIKRIYDPANFFHRNRNIRPA